MAVLSTSRVMFAGVLLAVVVVAAGQTTPTSTTSCPELTLSEGYNCLSSSDCSELQCQVPTSTVLVNGTANISLNHCDDPPLVNFYMEWFSGGNGSFRSISTVFRDDRDMMIDEGNVIRATVERNITTLSFLAVLVSSNLYLIPPVVYSINTTDCLCSSMEDLADAIHSPIEHDCAATPTCDGVTCQLDVLGNAYIVEMDVLSCAQPPGVDVLVIDSMGQIFYSTVVNDNTTGVILIGSYYVLMMATLIRHDYSIEVETNLIVPPFGIFQMIPRHSIVLDLSSCTNESDVTLPTAIPTTVPPPPPPPDNSPPLCSILYDMITSTRGGLDCTLSPSCTSVTCELVRDGPLIQLDMLILPQESDFKAHILYQPFYYAASEEWYVSVGSGMREFGADEGSTLRIQANATNTTLTLRMLLVTTESGQEQELIPETLIDLPSSEGCLWWLPVIEDYLYCSYLLDCQGILCLDHLAVESASISIPERCAETISVDLTLRNKSNGILFQDSFTETTVFDFPTDAGMYEGYLDIQRNDSILRVFMVSSFNTTYLYHLIPPITVPIDQQFCSCQSLEGLASNIHTPLESECFTNDMCNGIRCNFTVLGIKVQLETLLLSCNNPPAIETVLEDENNAPLSTNTASRTDIYYMRVNTLELPMYVEITHYNYSMDISATLMTPFNNVTIIPKHRLFLDLSSCTNESNMTLPTATPTIPPPPPPDHSPPLCIILYDMITSTRGGLDCTLSPSCTSVTCELVRDGPLIQLDMLILPQESDFKAHILYQPFYYAASEEWYVSVGSGMREFGADEGSTLRIQANATYTTLTLRMLLVTTESGQEQELIPETLIDLPSSEGCLWWLPVIEDYLNCSYLLDCQGILCLGHLAVESASISIPERCAETISVDLALRNKSNDILFQDSFTETTVLYFPTDYGVYEGHLDIQRNESTLRVFMISSFDTTYLYYLIPPITVPIDQQFCSCQSLEGLASNIHTPLEPECFTNDMCNGIRCKFTVLGSMFQLETLLLSCNNPPAIETVLEDENNAPLSTNTASRTGIYYMRVNTLELPMYVEITHYNYSMDISATLLTPFNFNATIIPKHRLFLDRSNCPTAIPPPSTLPTTISPPTYPTPSSPTCQALVDVAKMKAQEPFMCQVATDSGGEGECDSLLCQLDIGASSYQITLEVYPEGGQYVGSVRVTLGEVVLKNTELKPQESFTVNLNEGVLTFNFETRNSSLGIKVTLTVGGTTTELINSQVPLEPEPQSSKSDSKRTEIGVSVAVVLVGVAVAAAVIILVTIWQYRRYRTSRQFEFKPMTFSSLKETSEGPLKEDSIAGGTENVYEKVDSSLSPE